MRRALAAAAAVMLLAGCGGDSGDEYGAVAYCHQFIEDRLKSPGSAEFPSHSDHQVVELGGQAWRVAGWVDAENSFGASLRADWTCEIAYDPAAETWTLRSLTGL